MLVFKASAECIEFVDDDVCGQFEECAGCRAALFDARGNVDLFLQVFI